jgi:hypothetical protein
MLLPCPNAQLAAQGAGIGQNRDKYLVNPSATTPRHIQLFETLGRLMGSMLFKHLHNKEQQQRL